MAESAKTPPVRGRMVTLKYSAASMCGFVTDLAILKLGVSLGLSPAWARAISLFCAMQVTFCINGFLVFRCIEARRIHIQWAAYMAMNGFGNLCNYLVFTTLLSLHREVLSNHVFAVSVGAFVAWTINYAGTRLIVFNARARHWMERLEALGPGGHRRPSVQRSR